MIISANSSVVITIRSFAFLAVAGYLTRSQGLFELTNQVDEYIESIEKSELRIMFRYYFLDNLSYAKTAMRMNDSFPKRRTKYTDENIKKRIQRFFENVPQCSDNKM